jgi:triosephosphate isomerase (TIM)
MKKMFIVNLKTYSESTGKNAESMAKKFKKFNAMIAVQNADIFRASKINKNVFAQHMDPFGHGANTGKDIAECLKENGAIGVLINHSEDRSDFDSIKKCIEICKNTKMISVVCADMPANAEKIASFKPDYIAIEPPELIGSGISVSKAKPEIITDTIRRVKKISNTPVLCGAGISTAEDVKIAMRLGSSGILVASAVVKAEKPEKKLEELLSGF